MDSAGVTRRKLLGVAASAVAAGTAGCNFAVGEVATEESAEPTPPDPSAGLDGANPDQYDQFAQQEGSPYASVYRAVKSSVVQITIYTDASSAGGTGFVYDRQGHLVTNQHVVADATDVYVRFTTGGWRRARVDGADPYSDLAVLSVGSVPENADPLPLRETDPAVGTEVVAIGNPFGLSGSVSAGIVSGVNRTLSGPNEFSIPDAIQTDAPVNPGNSGGPLVTLDGRVAGVVNAGGGDNIGFAISSPLARRVVPELLASGSYDHSYMGVRIQNVTPLIAQANTLDVGKGVYVDDVVSGSPSDGVFEETSGSAAVSGRSVPTGGDVIVRMAETSIPTRQALASFLALKTSPGDTIDVEVIRDGERTTVELTLGERPDPP